eukprot:m.145952 g.145952  ORF g.145952 m.145952 type:complete len:82 (+) comp10086_c2_seq6:1504-1749(+)
MRLVRLAALMEELQRLVGGEIALLQKRAAALEPLAAAPHGWAIVSGSFNPLHDGHRAMAAGSVSAHRLLRAWPYSCCSLSL